ncbi:hypothetical protein [Treponema pedis]|nr:hypothetical protein [Treponema pedis]
MNIDELKTLLEEQQCSCYVVNDVDALPCDQELAVICEDSCAATYTF